MKRNLLTVLTALALCLSLCPTWALAAGAPTRTERLELYAMTDATENAAEGWKWEPSTCTLTLTNCYIKMENLLNIRFPGSGEAHLVLEGDNIIETSSTSFNYAIGSEGGQIELLKVSGNGSLTVTATTPGGNPSNAPYIFACQALTIEGSASIRSNMQLCFINKDFTLNGGSVTLKGEYVAHGIYVNAGDVIIKNGCLDISGGTTCMFLPGIPATPRTSNVKISGGTVKLQANTAAVYSAYASTQTDDTDNLEVTGGDVQITSPLHVRKIKVEEGANLTLNTTNGLVINANYNIGAKLAGGTYTGSAAAVQIINREDHTLAGLLAEGYAFYDINDDLIALEDGQKALSGTVTVKRCTHDSIVCEYVPAEDGTETHSMTCRACGKTETAEPCTYAHESVDDSNHKNICTLCGRETGAVAHTIGLTAAANGNTVTLSEGCTVCDYKKEELGTVSFTIPKLVYGQTDGSVTWTRSIPAEYDIVLSIDGGDTVRCGPSVLSQSLADLFGDREMTVGTHTLTVSLLSVTGTNTLELSFTIDPIPLSGTPVFGSGEGKKLGDVVFTLPEDWPEGGTLVWEAGADTQVVQGTSYAYTFTSPDGHSAARGSVVLWARPYTPPSGHTHAWAENWTASETHHWHECTASGCPVTANSGKNGYGEHVYDGGAVCGVCGWRRSAAPSGSSGGGGSGSHDTFAVTVVKPEHGNVTSSHAYAGIGSTVTLTTAPDPGRELDTLSVTDNRGRAVKLTDRGGGKYAFTMPGGSVTVRAVFTAPEETDCPSRAFSDLDTGAWYHEAVDHVLRNGLMGGYGNGLFGPDNVLTRAQFAQILYNREGRPAVTGGEAFTDVPPGAWYADAVAWAAARGIVSGYGGGRFGPSDPITREQLAVMLWRYAGSPAAGGEPPFRDAGEIGAHARNAVSWAVESGVMSGRGGGILDPRGCATRAQAAQMLRNFLENG